MRELCCPWKKYLKRQLIYIHVSNYYYYKRTKWHAIYIRHPGWPVWIIMPLSTQKLLIICGNNIQVCVDTRCDDKIKKIRVSKLQGILCLHNHVYVLIINIWCLVSHQIYQIWYFLERDSAKYLNGSIPVSIKSYQITIRPKTVAK